MRTLPLRRGRVATRSGAGWGWNTQPDQAREQWKSRRPAVIGAGVMGGGIAAHIANAGIPVVLMDIVPKGANNRNVVAETAIEKLKKLPDRSLACTRRTRAW